MLKRGLRSKGRRLTPAHLLAAIDAARHDDVLLVDWVNRGPVTANWGDAVAPVIAERLSGKRVVNRRDVLNLAGKPVYTTIGSMLGTIDTPKAVVWGTGFVETAAQLQVRPARICAVRGPLSRAKLLDAGVDCPELFGDPALLAPLWWKPAPEKRYRLGIIPHFRDTHLPSAQRFASIDGVRVIDIRAGLDEVVQQVTECERIASGSLHGLVLADAYDIPTTWIQFSDAAYGDGFKFRDYLESAGGRSLEPLEIGQETTIEQIEDLFVEPRMDVDRRAFVEACPFLDPDRLPELPW